MNPHPITEFSLLYYMSWQRRIEVSDIQDQLELQTWNLAPDRFRDLYLPKLQEQMAANTPTSPFSDQEQVITDPRDLDRYFEELSSPRTVTGAQVPDDEDGKWF